MEIGYANLAEKVKAFKKGKSGSVVVMYSAGKEDRFGKTPAKVDKFGLPVLVAATSPSQINQYKTFGYEVYKSVELPKELALQGENQQSALKGSPKPK